MTGRPSLTVRSYYPVSKGQRAAACLRQVCLYTIKGDLSEAKGIPFELPLLLTPLWWHQDRHLATRAARKPQVPEGSNSIQYP